MEEALQGFRVQLPWLAAHVEREFSGSGSWAAMVREGWCLISLPVGRQKYGALRRLMGGPEGRDVRRWRGEDLREMGFARRGLTAPPLA
jgi:hypothetical protein